MTKNKKAIIILVAIVVITVGIFYVANWYIFEKPRYDAINNVKSSLSEVQIINNNESSAEGFINGDWLTGNTAAAYASASFTIDTTFEKANAEVNSNLTKQGFILVQDNNGVANYVTNNKSLWQRYKRNGMTLQVEYKFVDNIPCPSGKECKYITEDRYSAYNNTANKMNVAISEFNNLQVSNVYIKYQSSEWIGYWQ